MWAVAGVLLGILLPALVGFHAGPHSHAAAGVLGVVVAAWLLIIALAGQAAPVRWVLFDADLVVFAGVGVAAWKGLQALHEPPMLQPTRLEGASGVAVSALQPEGLVRVRGEAWSATSLNGNLPTGAAVQVIGARGVRIEVWGEGVIPPHPDPLVIDYDARIDEERSGDTSEIRRAGS
jgi:membrane-bound ClpP family serine protease